MYQLKNCSQIKLNEISSAQQCQVLLDQGWRPRVNPARATLNYWPFLGTACVVCVALFEYGVAAICFFP